MTTLERLHGSRCHGAGVEDVPVVGGGTERRCLRCGEALPPFPPNRALDEAMSSTRALAVETLIAAMVVASLVAAGCWWTGLPVVHRTEDGVCVHVEPRTWTCDALPGIHDTVIVAPDWRPSETR